MKGPTSVEVSTNEKTAAKESRPAGESSRSGFAQPQRPFSRNPLSLLSEGDGLSLNPEQILYMQRVRGNRHVQRQVQRQAERRLPARDWRAKLDAASDLIDDQTGDAPSEGAAASLVLSAEPPPEPTANELVLENLADAERPPALALGDAAAEPSLTAPQSDTAVPALRDATSADPGDRTRDLASEFREIALSGDESHRSDGLVVQRWSLGDIVESVAGTLSSAAEAALAGIKSRIEGVVGGLQSGWSRLTSMASGVARSVSQGLQAAGSRLRGLAEAALSGLRGGWSALQQAASSLAEGVISRIQGGLQTVTGSIGAIAQAIINLDAQSLQDAWNRLRALLGGVWQQAQALARGLTQRIGLLWNSLRAQFTFISRSLADTARSIVNQLRSVAEGVRNQIVALWSGLQEQARQLGGIAGSVMRAIQAVVERLVSFARRIWDGIASGWAALQERIGAAIRSIGSRISEIIGQLRRQAEAIWAGITGLFGRLRAWAAQQMDRALRVVRVFWNAIRTFGIGQLIDTLVKCAPFLRAVREAVQDPNSVLLPIAQAIAARLGEAMPARAEQVARARVGGRGTGAAGAPQTAAGGPFVQRSVDHTIIQRQPLEQPLDWGTLWRGFWFVLAEKWNEFCADPVANILRILWELIAFWETVPRDVHGLVTDLERACSRMTTSGMGFWRHLIDMPLIIWRRVNQILLDLFPLFVLLSTAVGAIAGGVGGAVGGAILSFMAGGVGAAPGAGVGVAGGAGVGFGFAMGVGEGLLVSYILGELTTVVKAGADLLNVEQTEEEQAEDLDQMVSSSIGAAIASILWVISWAAGRFAKGLISNLKPGGAAARFFEGMKIGFRGGSPFRRWRGAREPEPPTERVTEEIEGPTEEVTEEVEAPTEEIEGPTEEVTEEIEAPTEEIEGPTEEIEGPTEEVTEGLEGPTDEVDLPRGPGRVNERVPGLYESIDPATPPPGEWTFTDTLRTIGDETTVRTSVTAPDGTTGTMSRSYNAATRKFSMNLAFLDGIPSDVRWVRTTPEMVPGRGTPLETYMTMRQMRILERVRGANFTGPRTVHMSTIINERTVQQIAAREAAIGRPMTNAELNVFILETHSVLYAENSITQSGGRIASAEVSGGIRVNASSALSAADRAAAGIPPDQQVLTGFDIDLRVVPAEAPPAP